MSVLLIAPSEQTRQSEIYVLIKPEFSLKLEEKAGVVAMLWLKLSFPILVLNFSKCWLRILEEMKAEFKCWRLIIEDFEGAVYKLRCS